MIVYKGLNIKKNYKKSVIAIGNFDGLHKGHKKVLFEAKNKAKKNKSKFGVVTFEPVPVMFFNKKLINHRINNLDQKILSLKKFGLDFVIIVNFNKKFSNLSPNNFIKKILYEKLRCRYIFVSKNFRFGKNRKGNIQTLKINEKNFFYKTIISSPFKKNNITISSTLIRRYLAKGNLKKVNSFLGRNWCIEGRVILGKKRGRKIGFPTCNIDIKNYIAPKLGVYSVMVETKKFKRKGIANIGFRPTFNGNKLLLEVNIFGIKANLYNKLLKVSFLKFIRGEKKFKSIDHLKKQIKKDLKKVRN